MKYLGDFEGRIQKGGGGAKCRREGSITHQAGVHYLVLPLAH